MAEVPPPCLSLRMKLLSLSKLRRVLEMLQCHMVPRTIGPIWVSISCWVSSHTIPFHHHPSRVTIKSFVNRTVPLKAESGYVGVGTQLDLPAATPTAALTVVATTTAIGLTSTIIVLAATAITLSLLDVCEEGFLIQGHSPPPPP